MVLNRSLEITGARATHAAMGTLVSHMAFGEHASEALTAVQAEITRLENVLSRFVPGSDISRINQYAGVSPVSISPDTLDVLSKAIQMASIASGSFDVTIGPLVALWHNCRGLVRPPDEASIKEVMPLVDFHCLDVDLVQSTARLCRKGQSIDPGGIGKGYAADRVLDIYQEYGIQSAYSNIGGNIVTLGCKPDSSPWHIGIQHPRREKDLIGTVSVSGLSVVTSGDYQRFFTGADGHRYHHILDPVTGYPANSGLTSVTVVCSNSMEADALSTILFVTGMEKGLSVLKQFPGAGAILVDTDNTVFVTHELQYGFNPEANIQVEYVNY
jgi:thiamine biosynthesis lipoprotein